MSKEDRKIVLESIISIESHDTVCTYSDIKHIDLQDEDIIKSGWSEPFFEEDNSGDGYYYIEVIRPRLENDEEYKRRLEKGKEEKKMSDFRQLLNYLNGKRKFERTCKMADAIDEEFHAMGYTVRYSSTEMSVSVFAEDLKKPLFKTNFRMEELPKGVPSRTLDAEIEKYMITEVIKRMKILL